MADTKVCTKCKQELAITEFGLRGDRQAGRGRKSRCRTCTSNYFTTPAARANSARWRLEHPEQVMVISARLRAVRAGIPFALTVADVVVPDTCPILGIPLARTAGRPAPSSPTLDRIRPELGYVPGNVQVISHRANTMKSDATFQEMVMLGDWARQYGPVS
jgi:hypothetical protein